MSSKKDPKGKTLSGKICQSYKDNHDKHEDLLVKVFRIRKSYDYKYDPSANSYQNNIKNNCIDTLVLFQIIGGEYIELYRCDTMQSVSNHPEMSYFDTLATDKSFDIVAFVPPGTFGQEIHGIADALDLDGEPIDKFCMQIEDGRVKGRWLVHSTYNPETYKDWTHAWSGGCIIFALTKDLKKFNDTIRAFGVAAGDIIPAIIVEV